MQIPQHGSLSHCRQLTNKRGDGVAALVFIVLSFLFVPLGCGGVDPVDEVGVSQSGSMEELTLPQFTADDWPAWRGPSGDGVAAQQEPPVKWGAAQNVLWKAEAPGRGHASPTVLGNRIFLPTADEGAQTQSVVCFDRDSGARLWRTQVHQGNFAGDIHGESTHASCTAACDAQRVFVAFPNHGAIWLTALDLKGKLLWQTNLGAFASEFGYGASPVIYKSYVIVAADQAHGGYLVAVHRQTGKIRWRKRRPGADSYASPAVFRVGEKHQLLISGAQRLASYNPDTGEELWSCRGTADLTAGTPVRNGNLVYASGGYPQIELVCARLDGAGEAVWRTGRTKIYTSSMVVHAGYLYAATDGGVAHCWQAQTGELMWKHRLGGKVRASLVSAGGHIYIARTNGKTIVFKATPKAFEKVADNTLGDEMFATPTICGGRLYMRIADSSSGSRKETLYCIAKTGRELGQAVNSP